MPILLGSGQLLLSEDEQTAFKEAADSLNESDIEITPLTGPISLFAYCALLLRHAVLTGDDDTVQWAEQLLEAASKSRERPN